MQRLPCPRLECRVIAFETVDIETLVNLGFLALLHYQNIQFDHVFDLSSFEGGASVQRSCPHINCFNQSGHDMVGLVLALGCFLCKKIKRSDEHAENLGDEKSSFSKQRLSAIGKFDSGRAVVSVARSHFEVCPAPRSRLAGTESPSTGFLMGIFSSREIAFMIGATMGLPSKWNGSTPWAAGLSMSMIDLA
ncbi:hypothetical protein ETAA8_40960 [Anatilimnocola aggregata]|uniref:Uncharacterized protein n=1 Tax=Anatilimnocola aggregata TaxID=2528021 RepID=A0A517YFI6_9BACT|nr:hypothetical protein ETAA8_40960 [Anatilimnocola aggregata]